MFDFSDPLIRVKSNCRFVHLYLVIVTIVPSMYVITRILKVKGSFKCEVSKCDSQKLVNNLDVIVNNDIKKTIQWYAIEFLHH